MFGVGELLAEPDNDRTSTKVRPSRLVADTDPPRRLDPLTHVVQGQATTISAAHAQVHLVTVHGHGDGVLKSTHRLGDASRLEARPRPGGRVDRCRKGRSAGRPYRQ